MILWESGAPCRLVNDWVSVMKAKMRVVPAGEDSVAANERVRSEIQIFLEALDSYPERFANEPGVSFEEHRTSLLRRAKAASSGSV